MKIALELEAVNKEEFSVLGNDHFSFMMVIPKKGYVPKKNFGYFYSNSNVYSVTWDGDIDFSKIHNTALRTLPSLFRFPTGGEQFENTLKSPKESIHVNMMIRSPEGKTRKTFDLSSEDSRRVYFSYLHNYNLISFVRYDVTLQIATRSHSYSVTAVNPKAKHLPNASASDLELKVFPELGFMLPIKSPFTIDMFKWIVEHHKAKTYCVSHVDLEKSTANIQSCLEDIIIDRLQKADEKVCDPHQKSHTTQHTPYK